MEIQKIAINKINPAKYNPRKDLQPGDIEYEKIKRSIIEFDLVEPLIVNKQNNNLIGGHQRLKVLKELGKEEVEVVIVDLPASKEKALNIALNKVQGEWDFPKLKDLLQELDTGEWDMEITGFKDTEIENLMTQFHIEDLDEILRKGEEIETAEETSDIIAEKLSGKIKDIARQYPEKLNHALSIIIPLKKGNEIFIIADPTLKDFIDEIKRYAEAGEYSPLELILSQIVSMKWK